MSRMAITGRGAWLFCLSLLAAVPFGSAIADPTPSATPAPAPTKTPSKVEIGAMLKACSAEADAKGLTVQKGKGEERKAYRRACMTKKGVAPRSKS